MSAENGPPQVPGRRTSEQREQARREREARRAARTSRGSALPAAQDAPEPPSARPLSEKNAVGEPPARPDGELATEAGHRSGGDTEPEAQTSAQPGLATEVQPAEDGQELLPPVRRRRTQPRGAIAPPDSPNRRAGAGGSDDAANGPEPRRRRLGVRVLLALVLLLALGAVAALAITLLRSDTAGASVRVDIPLGAGVSDIGDLLERRGVISSGALFELRATLAGQRGELRPGSYQLRRDMGYGSAIDALGAGPPVRRTPVVDVTIPEGRSRREISPLVRRAGLRGSYSRASVRSPELRPRRYGAVRARDLEGFLFPATYELRRSARASDLVEKQLQAFRREFGGIDLRAARRRNLTPYDVVTIASMVEREAQVPRERPQIAAVIYNRLRQGIPLSIDATTRYETNNWTRPLRESVLQSDTPYNTRTNPGLPPTPIGNPGIASLRAAARPARSDAIYYVVKPGTCGEHVFSETGAEFERDVARYNAARARRGGKSPTNC